ncbi:MAG TPA: sigma-70 family RNA polymerase sigma factor [Solirubrobacterales bacterium]|nr:sigma-70 family RNA polymerase sigma factor [Solirubrobacterales bacterium]
MDLLEHCTDAGLLARTERDPLAFAAFYRRHERLVFRYLMSRCRDPELAADLAAEVFASALEAAGRFKPEPSSGSSGVPWLLTIARNTLLASVRHGVVVDYARRRLHCEPLVLDDDALTRVEDLASLDLPIEQLLAYLPDDLRDAVVARVLEERDYEEIATQLGCSQQVVRKRVSRGLGRLRSALLPASQWTQS